MSESRVTLGDGRVLAIQVDHVEVTSLSPRPDIAGAVHYTLDGVPITEDQYQAMMAALFASR